MNVSAWPLGFTQPILHIVISLALSTQRVQTDNNERLRLLSSPPGPPSSPSSQHTMVDFLIPQPPLAQLKYRVSSARCVRAIAAFISFIIFSPLDPLSESRRVASRRPCQTMQSNPRPSCLVQVGKKSRMRRRRQAVNSRTNESFTHSNYGSSDMTWLYRVPRYRGPYYASYSASGHRGRRVHAT